MACVVQTMLSIVNRIITVNMSLSEQDEALKDFLPVLIKNIQEAEQLVKRASSMGGWGQYLTATTVRGEFQDMYTVLNCSLGSEYS